MYRIKIWLYRLEYNYTKLKRNWYALKNDFVPRGSMKYYLNSKKELRLLQDMNDLLDREKLYIIGVMEKYNALN